MRWKNLLPWVQTVVIRPGSRGIINISGSCFHFLMISVNSDEDMLTFIEAEFTLSHSFLFFFLKTHWVCLQPVTFLELMSLPSRFVSVGKSMCPQEVLSYFGWGFWAFFVRTLTHFKTTFMGKKTAVANKYWILQPHLARPSSLNFQTQSWVVLKTAFLAGGRN